MAFVKQFKSKRYGLNFPHLRKFFHWVFVKFQTTGDYPVGYTANIDYGRTSKNISLVGVADALLWDDGDWDEEDWGGVNVSEKFVHVAKKGRTIQHQILNDQPNQPVFLYAIGTTDVTVMGKKGGVPE